LSAAFDRQRAFDQQRTFDQQRMFDQLWESLLPVGRDEQTGGYRRLAWTAADIACREWFVAAAEARDLTVETDGNANLWAWWGEPGPGSVAVGSHLDSVPDGGAFDGPLGVVSAFAALDVLRDRGVRPRRPLAVVAFADEEGGRFGVACVGSRLMTGALDPDRARELADADGITLAAAMADAGHDPGRLGRDDDRLGRLAAYVELHVEQGRGLADLDRPVGVGTGIWPHGRYRCTFEGRADHAGTTRLEDRADPMLTYAETVLAARKRARLAGARATFGRVHVEPNATNAIPSRVVGWLDLRAADEPGLEQLLADVRRGAQERAARDGTTVEVAVESQSPAVVFDAQLRDRMAGLLDAPTLATQAGHDAGVLATDVPTGMLFVRNRTGVSHSPLEHADPADCHAGVLALATVLEAELAVVPGNGGAG